MKKFKTLVCDKYKRALRSVLKSKLSGEILVKVINICAASVVRYTAAIGKWIEEQVESSTE